MICSGTTSANSRQRLDKQIAQPFVFVAHSTESSYPLARMFRVLFVALLMGGSFVHTAGAQTSDEALPLYYAVERDATIYSSPDSSKPYVQLKFREPVYRLDEQGRWLEIRTQDGAQGFVQKSVVSNVWIRVSKANKTLYVYRGTDLIKTIPAEFGLNAFADKERRGSATEPDHWRTPDGVFFVVNRNPNSQFYKALVLNYPTAEDAERGRKKRLISEKQYRAIIEAEENFESPPMNTALGGWIEIHGRGTGSGSNWTQGCVAVRDAHIDELWQWAQVGTPVLIE